MIRKTGLIKLIRSWSPPDLSDQASVESAWNDWARHETLKRFVRLNPFTLPPRGKLGLLLLAPLF